MTKQQPRRLGFFLVPGFSNLNYAALLEPFRIANTVEGACLYEWQTYSTSNEPVISSSGVAIPVDGSIFDDIDVQDLFVIAGYGVTEHCHKKTLSRLRKLVRFGCRIGGFDTGAFVLGSAGLLDGYKATVHWEAQEEFSDRFPRVDLVPNRFIIDRGRFTSGGAITSLDFALTLIAEIHGKAFALAVSSRFIYSQEHHSTDPQMVLDVGDLQWRDPYLGKAIILMRQNTSPPLNISMIAKQIGVGMRDLQRRFKKKLSKTPEEYYREIKLNAGRQLVLYSRWSIEEIADSVGYESGSAFARAYRKYYGQSPSSMRQNEHLANTNISNSI